MEAFTWVEYTSLSLLLVALLAEWLHVRRTRRLGLLAFGLGGRPRRWVMLVPFLRALCVAAIGWSLLSLLLINPMAHGGGEEKKVDEKKYHRLLLVLDVSPSMYLEDAGPERDQDRRHRAYDVLRSVFERIAVGQTRITIVAFHSKALPVVVDTVDMNVVRNFLNEMPLTWAFDPGKTDMLAGLNEALELAEDWPHDSTTLMLVSDGDHISDQGLNDVPKSIRDIMVVGVGDTQHGEFIDGHLSMQFVPELRSVARRLRGEYYNVNEKHLPSESLMTLSRTIAAEEETQFDRRLMALVLLMIAATILALLPLATDFFGSPVRTLRNARNTA
jgi:Ca-activated chloride channel family protein